MSGTHQALNGGDTPHPNEHHHRRSSDPGTDSRRHRRSKDDDTPPTPIPLATGRIKFTQTGLFFPWSKILGFLTGLSGPVGVGVLSWSHFMNPAPVVAPVDAHPNKIDEKLDQMLKATERVEKKVDAIDERQRQTELDVATLKARIEKGERR